MKYLIFPKVSKVFFKKALTRSKNVIHKHIDLMAGEIDYYHYFQFVVKKVGKHALRPITKNLT
jgi:hypothetical protein